MGFEFGYAVAEHRALVIWEAQFGDFMNGAQVIIDQFIACSETKWGSPSGLVLLLPHGYEGQGPEHSSARIERFLTLCAEDNMRVVNPSTPAPYFHLLRRQGRDDVEKPLVVFTPKSLLRHPRCVSTLARAGRGPLRAGARRRGRGPGARAAGRPRERQALLRPAAAARSEAPTTWRWCALEQLYPFPAPSSARCSRATRRARVVWAQEEPRNMGAWRFVREPSSKACAGAAAPLPRYVGRGASASPAPGSHKVHLVEQDAIVAEALG